MTATFLVSLLAIMTPMVMDCVGLFRPQLPPRMSWAIVVAAVLVIILYILMSAACLRWDPKATVCTVWA